MLNIFYIHFGFFIFFFSASIVFIYVWVITLSKSSLFYLMVPLFDGLYNWNYLEIILDPCSLIFSSIVMLIAAVMSWFSFYYFSWQSTKLISFLTLKLFFVLSMMVVINFGDLFSIMLGWDGLGFVSFFLIMFYQSSSSITSASFTLMMNRLGDGTFLLSLGLLSGFSYSSFSYYLMDYLFMSLLLVTFMTKSALFPFSSWLPIAMAAPTPISALVHSSTLVTAGLYLMIRFSFYFYGDLLIMKFIFLTSVFTSFYAGMATLVENDLKKMIALSTLSHLGFIGMSFSLGLVELAFFHLLSHALFKSLLFMSMGDIITNYSHSQDSRFISTTVTINPYSVSLMRLSLLSLLGLPSLSGFFSKELILEFLLFNPNSFILYFVVVVNILMTFYYTFFLMSFSYSGAKVAPFMACYTPSVIYMLMGSLLGVASIVFGSYYLSLILSLPTVCVPPALKLLPLCLLSLAAFLNIYNLKFKFNFTPALSKYLSSMLYLHTFIVGLNKVLFTQGALFLYKSVEIGLYSTVINKNSFNLASLLTVKFMTTVLKVSYKSLVLLVLIISWYF